MTWLVVARERDAGMISVGAFLIDAWCLGVKDAYVDEMSRPEFQELLDEQLPEDRREAIAPAAAKQIVEGAVAYAQGLGFLPHRDFRKARKVLNGITVPAAEARAYTFGCEGKPCFVIGPDDDDMRINRVLTLLKAKLGEEGFTWIDPEADIEADMEAIDALCVFVESPDSPDAELTGFVVEGFVTAALLAPGERDAMAWWLALWDGQDPVFPDESTGEIVVAGWLCLWGGAARALADETFVPSLPSLDEPEHRDAAAEYCRGFLRGCELLPAMVAHVNADPTAAAELEVLRRLTEAGEPTAVGRRDLAPVLGRAVCILFASTTTLRATTPPAGA